MTYYLAMIAYLEGIIRIVDAKHMIIDVHGVGYRVAIPAKMMSIIPEIGQSIKVFTHYVQNTRDGSVELFGFMKPEELNFFGLMTSISGIGPRTAHGILASVDLETLHRAIMHGDSEILTRVGGIGAKTAQRLVLELKNKVDGIILSPTSKAEFEVEQQGIEALMALGYSAFQARDALNAVAPEVTRLEDRVTAGLKLLGQKK